MVLKLIGKILLLMLLVVMACLVMIRFGLFSKENYYYTIQDKCNRLATTPSPKFILVGGSNTAFGLDSKKIQEATNYPVVNMGSAADIGLRYMIQSVRQYIHKDDIVVVIPEYYQFTTYFNGSSALTILMEVYPQSVQYYTSREQYLNALRGVPSYLRLKFTSMLKILSGYKEVLLFGGRKAFNEYGDYTYRDAKRAEFDVGKQSLFGGHEELKFEKEAIEFINEFYRFTKEKGATALFFFPAISQYHYNQNVNVIEEIDSTLRSGLEIPILNSPTDEIYPLDLFYDSPYHLSLEGRDRRTDKFIEYWRHLTNAPLLTAEPK
ncbi:MAG: hypothetical protein CO189_01835 [candidate division Zixibacteria bacterium CG_4_9_14_3_um_filter_46_8]|nr:MAG: hypothetical protein CO189_01835 [candidate division Zixibacteria bacterium CG_4_9_14_3_um_filter_46_8]